MRRTAALIALAVALAGGASASASLIPLRRHFGDVTITRFTHGAIPTSIGNSRRTIRVVVTLPLAPLAVAYGDGLGFRLGTRRLDTKSRTAQSYLAREHAAQQRAIGELRRAIPQARVSWRYSIVLDGFTVSLPARSLPRLLGLGFVGHVYPSLRYTETLNRSRDVIGATQLAAATGATGAGIKIGVVDDGIDQTSQFFNPSGFSYPAGFPKGTTSFTSPKVIVARAFPGPESGSDGSQPLVRTISFHGTHVAGIAAGDAGTTAPPGRDHPVVSGLSGVAPRAWLGNYRVLTAPDDSGETPEVVAGIEAATADGMDVINLSLGGPEVDPANDASIAAIENATRAGVVAAIAAGNDRDSFGLGTVGTPGSAPDAITVAAVSNSHFFGREATVVSPALQGSNVFPIVPTQDGIPVGWADSPQTLVDVGKLVGANGKGIDRHLCGPSSNPNLLKATLKAGALKGKIALVERGLCSFVSKAYRAVTAGAIGMIVIDNRAGDPNPIPISLGVPAAMISDLDGARLISAMGGNGGTARLTVGRDVLEIATDRAGVITSFSSAGPTDFAHQLKPDISAPGAQILSSTLPEFAGSPFAVFDGTSMATPHIAGSAALLLQQHPGWTPKQVKSALMTTAGPAFADTSKTAEASVLEEGAGLAWLPSANKPLVFSDPQSLSFGDLNVLPGAQSRQLQLTVSDAGGGDGTWQVEIHPQSASTGASLDVQPIVLLAPGGSAALSVTARAAADAPAGDDYGFLVLRRGGDTRRVPYDFSVTRPGLAASTAVTLKTLQSGDTRKGTSRAFVYRWPAEPFGPPPSFTGPPMDEIGKEHVYVTTLSKVTVNFGVSIQSESSGSLVEPWLLRAKDESSVGGYAGTPVNVNGLMFDYRGDIGAAGASFAQPGKYYVAVDSQRDPFTGKSLAGSYVLRSWVNDVTPPRAALLTTRVAAGRPTIALHVTDSQSGVDPYSVVFAYGRQLVGAVAYDPKTGTVLIPLPAAASRLGAGRPRIAMLASDYQEAKNVDTVGPNELPNTTARLATLTVVNGPAITWIAPQTGVCAAKKERLVVLASDTAKISSVTFYDGARKIGTDTTGPADLFFVDWKTGAAAHGRHTLRAVVTDRAGKTASADRPIRVC